MISNWMQAFFFAPAFLLSLGAVLFFDGLSIYQYYQISDGASSNGSVNIQCLDLRFHNETVGDVNGEDFYITIEFAGALTSVVFYVSILIIALTC